MSSSNITHFESGAIRDSQDGKPDFVETTSPWADWRYAQYMTGKKKKYGQGNFKKGITRESYMASLMRHVAKLRALEDCKTFNLPTEEWMEAHEDHAAAIRFNIDGLMHQEEVDKTKHRDMEQIDKGLGYSKEIIPSRLPEVVETTAKDVKKMGQNLASTAETLVIGDTVELKDNEGEVVVILKVV